MVVVTPIIFFSILSKKGQKIFSYIFFCFPPFFSSLKFSQKPHNRKQILFFFPLFPSNQTQPQNLLCQVQRHQKYDYSNSLCLKITFNFHLYFHYVLPNTQTHPNKMEPQENYKQVYDSQLEEKQSSNESLNLEESNIIKPY